MMRFWRRKRCARRVFLGDAELERTLGGRGNDRLAVAVLNVLARLEDEWGERRWKVGGDELRAFSNGGECALNEAQAVLEGYLNTVLPGGAREK